MSTAVTADRSADTVPSRNGGHPAQRRWPLERVLFLMAGTMTGLSALLAAFVSPWFLLLTGFVAVNQLAFVAFGNCPSSLLLRRYAGLRGAGE
ncbi:MAG: hypothetical protein K0R41_1294 [Geminicoccaceae bacterium]|jgi:hypothetical protein|nr:hypothetical protein [Geminicoccaceae bacterium]MCE3247469.1 hypothetical protein [Geminicoccaceae bacterium]